MNRRIAMLSVIIGASASGKSAYAEKRALELADGGALYYVATMEPGGEEGRRRIERHRRMRAGLGFTTIERYRAVGRALDGVDAASRGSATVLLECLSNLLANEMFPAAGAARRGADEGALPVPDRILADLTALSGQCRHLVVVTNEVFADGTVYDRETMIYIKYLGELNQKLMDMADEAIEVVYTISMYIKLCKLIERHTDGAFHARSGKDNI